MKTLMPILSNGYSVNVIEYGEDSPMEGHKGGEIAADDKHHAFYVYEVTVVANGTDSILKACNSYPVPLSAVLDIA